MATQHQRGARPASTTGLGVGVAMHIAWSVWGLAYGARAYGLPAPAWVAVSSAQFCAVLPAWSAGLGPASTSTTAAWRVWGTG